MKNLHVFMMLMIVAVVGFSSCSKDDDNKKKEAEITGTWGITSFDYEGYFDIAGENYVPVIGQSTGTTLVRLTFNSDGTVSSNGKSFTFFIMSKENKEDRIKFTPTLLEHGGTWKKEGNTLYIDDFFDESIDQIIIAELTATTMHLTATFENEPGSDMTSTIDMKLVRKD